MMKNTPSGAKKHRESTKPESRQMDKMFFLLLCNRWQISAQVCIYC